MLIAFVPVIHQGYLELFKKHPESLGILGPDIIADYSSLTRDLRTIDPEAMKQAIEGLGIFASVQVLNHADLAKLATECDTIVMPDEDVSRDLAQKYFKDDVRFEPIFLRWHKPITLQENVIAPHRVISRAQFDQDIMKAAVTEAQKSFDWWRQVGTVLVKDEHIIASGHNKHLPSDFHLAQNGDPRVNFNPGEQLGIYTAVHSEAATIAACAKAGISTQGAQAFVTTFPCPNCARLLVEAGISKVYYQKGYSLLDAESILGAVGIEIILVQD